MYCVQTPVLCDVVRKASKITFITVAAGCDALLCQSSLLSRRVPRRFYFPSCSQTQFPTGTLVFFPLFQRAEFSCSEFSVSAPYSIYRFYFCCSLHRINLDCWDTFVYLFYIINNKILIITLQTKIWTLGKIIIIKIFIHTIYRYSDTKLGSHWIILLIL